ncbi:hypothetical protein [Halomicrococcus sp. NG-SE-24]|uniref:hypothetical protein n=1 Tax=Halomicrococcus sp. NG-SE-24 TaxID=3436928 RepID=UPI003D9568B9
MAEESVPFWWILLFVLLALGAGAILFVGGELLAAFAVEFAAESLPAGVGTSLA